MLVKKIQLEDDVLSVLKGMEWADDGLVGKITCGQLDRKLYVKVNKALDSMGGQWNRKLGGHVFPSDPRSQVEGLLDSGVLVIEKDGFFETPLAVCMEMFSQVTPDVNGRFLEPSAGRGAIARSLVEYGVPADHITLIEKNAQRCEELKKEFPIVINQDFLTFSVEESEEFDFIYMNPPFEMQQDIDHVRHAYSLLNDGGSLVSVMGEGTFFRQDKKALSFLEWMDSIHCWDVKLPEGSFKESGTMVNTRLFVV